MEPVHHLWGKRLEGSPHAASRHLAGHMSHKAEDFMAVPSLPGEGGELFSDNRLCIEYYLSAFRKDSSSQEAGYQAQDHAILPMQMVW